MNRQLRAHVTRTAFDLSLGKLHVFHLVRLDLGLEERGLASTWKWYGEQFIKGHRGLEARGLIRHTSKESGWELTVAGRAVVILLRESGLYGEIESTMYRKSA